MRAHVYVCVYARMHACVLTVMFPCVRVECIDIHSCLYSCVCAHACVGGYELMTADG